MNQTATPRTDALHAEQGISPRKVFDLARTLERENARLREALERIADPNSSFADKALLARAALQAAP